MSVCLHPCLWFDGNAKEAADLYCSVFDSSTIKSENPFVVMFDLLGQTFMGLNGGDTHKINPSISFMVTYQNEEEIRNAWELLSIKGNVLMPLDKYDWSECYGWVEDKFDVNWQLYLGEKQDTEQRISPTLMFVSEQNGKAEQAINYYTSIFDNSNIKGILKYNTGDDDIEGNVKHAQFSLNGYTMMAMDSSADHKFQFSEGVSIVITCDTQDEIDYYWDKLKDGGEEDKCGWLKDQFGVSWQVVPRILGELMSDPIKSPRVVDTFMNMTKLDIEKLKNA
jgi:predicted 3-demethylubiquinone-9 3-methyltransferase (glyoxalase superfamily)